MDDLTFEDKVALLVLAKDPKAKADLIRRWSNDSEFHYGVNGRTMPMEQYMKQSKFAATAKYVKELKQNQTNRGWSAKKYQKHLAEIPADIFFSRPEFSAHLPNKVLSENIRKFLKQYPGFKVGQ